MKGNEKTWSDEEWGTHPQYYRFSVNTVPGGTCGKTKSMPVLQTAGGVRQNMMIW